MRHKLLFVALASFFCGLNSYAKIDLEKIIEIGLWSKADLQSLLEPTTYQESLNAIREILNSKIGNELDKLKIIYDNPKQLTSLFIAYGLIFLKPLDYSFSNDLIKALTEASNNSSWNPTAIETNKEIGRQVFREMKNEGKTQIAAALTKLSLSNNDRNVAELYLADIFFLAYMKQNFYLDYFARAYISALIYLITDVNFTVTDKEILQHIKQPTWNSTDQEIAKHPMIVMLKQIMEPGE